MSQVLTYQRLIDAVAGEAVAARSVAKLQPAGGQGDKVFPPTYQGGRYAVEERRVGDRVVVTVLLDSVQSQANRLEQALKRAWERGEVRFPLVVTDFTGAPDADIARLGRITALDAPHRIADAIFRESLLDGQRFHESDAGRRFRAARTTTATALFELCPTALVFGVWDSTGLEPRAGLGAKFQRALVSEIVGFDANLGVRTASKLDPLPISAAVPVYEAADGWTVDEDEAVRDEKGEPKLFKRAGAERERPGRPSTINLGNVTPDIATDQRTREALAGGATIAYAQQTTVLSFPALRRLRFPLADGSTSEEIDRAARGVLSALALAAVAYQRQEGYDLRSRCLLVPIEPASFDLVDGNGETHPFSLDTDTARQIFEQAVAGARQAGLPWTEEEIVLTPSDRLLALVRKSLDLGIPVEGGGSAEEEE